MLCLSILHMALLSVLLTKADVQLMDTYICICIYAHLCAYKMDR